MIYTIMLIEFCAVYELASYCMFACLYSIADDLITVHVHALISLSSLVLQTDIDNFLYDITFS